MYLLQLHNRIADCENKISRIKSGEKQLQNPDKVIHTLSLIVLKCEEKLFQASLI